MKLLENTRVTLKTVNRLDNLEQSKVYENVALSDDEEYVIEFQVPANLSKIIVSVETFVNVRINSIKCQIQVVTKSARQAFGTAETFEINNHEDDHIFCDVYFRNVDGNYLYTIRGKNGEPVSGVLIDFEFAHKYLDKKQL